MEKTKPSVHGGGKGVSWALWYCELDAQAQKLVAQSNDALVVEPFILNGEGLGRRAPSRSLYLPAEIQRGLCFKAEGRGTTLHLMSHCSFHPGETSLPNLPSR